MAQRWGCERGGSGYKSCARATLSALYKRKNGKLLKKNVMCRRYARIWNTCVLVQSRGFSCTIPVTGPNSHANVNRSRGLSMRAKGAGFEHEGLEFRVRAYELRVWREGIRLCV